MSYKAIVGVTRITLEDIAERVQSIRELRQRLATLVAPTVVPSQGNTFHEDELLAIRDLLRERNYVPEKDKCDA